MVFFRSYSCKVLESGPAGTRLEIHGLSKGKTQSLIINIGAWQQQMRLRLEQPQHAPHPFILLGLDHWHIDSSLPHILGLPESLLNALTPFRGLWFPMAQICAREPAARDLLNNNPVLLWLLLYGRLHRDSLIRYYLPPEGCNYNPGHVRAKLNAYPAIDLFSVLSRKQHEIIAMMNGLCSRSTARMLRRIVVKKADEFEYLSIMRLLKSERLQQFFRHWPILPAFCIYYFSQYPELMDIAFLRAPAIIPSSQETIPDNETDPEEMNMTCLQDREDGQRWLDELHQLVDDTLNMARLTGRPVEQVRQMLIHARHEESIHRYHDKLIREYNLGHRNISNTGWNDIAHVLNDGGEIFPTPPLPGTNTIVPIHSSEDLIAEGIYMEHCIASYRDPISRGECYAYRVLSPQRATLCISGQVPFVIHDLRLARNAPVSESTRRAVEKWLKIGNGFQSQTNMV